MGKRIKKGTEKKGPLEYTCGKNLAILFSRSDQTPASTQSDNEEASC